MVVESRSALAASAYLYGFPLVFNLDQVDRYVTTGWVRTRRHRSTASATPARSPARGHVRHDQQRHGVLDGAARPQRRAGRCCTSPTPTAATTCCSSSTPGPTTSPTSATAPPAPARATSCSSRPAGPATPPAEPPSSDFPTRSPRSSAAGPAPAPTTSPPCTPCRTPPTLTPLDADAPRRPVCRSPTPTCREDLVFFEKLRRLVAGVPAGRRATSRCRQSFAAARRHRDGTSPYAIAGRRRSRPRSRTGTPHGETTLAQVAALAAQQPGRERLEADLPRVRLQPRLLRGRRPRRSDSSRSPTRRCASSSGPPRPSGGLWGNHAYEAAYIMTYVDDHGEQLTGDQHLHAAARPDPAGRARSGRSRCTTSRTSTSSPTRSTATRSATAPPASSTTPTAR